MLDFFQNAVIFALLLYAWCCDAYDKGNRKTPYCHLVVKHSRQERNNYCEWICVEEGINDNITPESSSSSKCGVRPNDDDIRIPFPIDSSPIGLGNREVELVIGNSSSESTETNNSGTTGENGDSNDAGVRNDSISTYGEQQGIGFDIGRELNNIVSGVINSVNNIVLGGLKNATGFVLDGSFKGDGTIAISVSNGNIGIEGNNKSAYGSIDKNAESDGDGGIGSSFDVRNVRMAKYAKQGSKGLKGRKRRSKSKIKTEPKLKTYQKIRTTRERVTRKNGNVTHKQHNQ